MMDSHHLQGPSLRFCVACMHQGQAEIVTQAAGETKRFALDRELLKLGSALTAECLPECATICIAVQRYCQLACREIARESYSAGVEL